jgi:ornithine cyclodeaminase/alanine dehydrogenase-like protein (mu-crystallin family)
MLIVDEATCRELLTMEEAIPQMASSFAAISRGPTLGTRGDVQDPEHNSAGLFLGSYVGALNGVCFKLIGSWNGRRGGLIALFDTATSQPEALVAATRVTDLRTGAASGAATQLLARVDSRRLAILGTGRQSTTQLQAMLCVRPIQEVSVWNRTVSKCAAWIESTRRELGEATPEIRSAATPQEACDGADIVVVCTRSEEPVLRGEWLRPGAHINAIGASTPEQTELDVSVLRRADVISVDSRELALRTGDFIGPMERGELRPEEVCEIGEIFLGRRPGRSRDEEITLFKSVGHSANDLVLARFLAEKARAAGRAHEIPM